MKTDLNWEGGNLKDVKSRNGTTAKKSND